jgi:uncharacterized protein YndB with AHSA1/START domain
MKQVDLEIVKEFDAPVASVWRAWSDAQWLKQWWGPDRFSCPSAEVDFREGGRAVVAMLFPKDMGGVTMYNLFEFKKIVPMESIEFTNNLCDKQGKAADPAALGMPPDFPVNQRVLLTFQDLGQGRSRLTVTECKWTPGQMMKMAKMGMEQSLEKLAALPGLRG